ncbi:MAG: hypothetical protein J6C64_09545 [Lachnospiraceae bacterium]|nr:hypothetical protein [Lachnospiraceae bacterium]
MRIDEYINMCENVQISDVVSAGYQNAIDTIKMERNRSKKKNGFIKRKKYNTLSKAAIVIGVLFILSGSTVLSVKAYISHMEKMRNMKDEEIIDLYENVFQYDRKRMSRALSEEEEKRFSELFDLYCRDMAEPSGEAIVISSKDAYMGQGIAFSTEDGILYMPENEMSDEELLQLVVFNLLERYVDYEAYVKASNPLYYVNYLDQMSMTEVDEIYINYYSANTETSFFSRELTFDELGRRKALKMLYKNSGKLPEHPISIIQSVNDYEGEGIAFCSSNCTYYFPEHELSDEQLLELIDFQIKVEYCRQRIKDEINRGIRSDWPEIEYVERERIVTLDTDMKVDETIISQPWLSAYEGILNQYFKTNSEIYEEPERYYVNVCFIYLNDDEIPEMLLSYGCTDLDYDDHCNRRDYLYTYKNEEAVLLSPGVNTMDDFYGYVAPFSYAERRGMVYCDYYYIYNFSTYDNETDIIDNVNDKMSRMDIWDFDTLTCTSSNANIEMLHAVYNYVEEEYSDADFSYEYYVNVTDIIRDENTGYVSEIAGEKVDRQTYEASEKALWNGEQITTLSVSDFDKIYSDDNLSEALAKCYIKKIKN